MRNTKYFWISLLFCWGIMAQAQSIHPGNISHEEGMEPVEADRPGLGESVHVLPAGVLQVEGGFRLDGEAEEHGVTRGFSGGNPLLRLGIGHRSEIRIGGEGLLLRSHRRGSNRSIEGGMADPVLSAKIALLRESDLLPALTVIPGLSLPVGHRLFTSGGRDPEAVLVWSKSLGGQFTAGGDFGIASITEEGHRSLERSGGFELSRTVWRDVEGFGELYLTVPGNHEEKRIWTFDTGIVIPAGPNTKFDISAGRQIFHSTSGWFVAAGFAVRMPALFHRP